MAERFAYRDLTGQRFGKLVCQSPTSQRDSSGAVIWLCRCDCGSLCCAASTQLLRGNKKSCGCLSHPPLKNLLHKRFGSLEVIGYAGKRDGKHYWRCRCDCGNETEVCQSNLQSGHTVSCGCAQRQTRPANLKLLEGTSVTIIEKRLKTPIKTNTSGYNGVYFNRKNGTWCAQITFKGKTYFLGSYRDLSDAVKARKRGEEMYEDFLNWYYKDYLKTARSDRQQVAQ